MKYKLTENKKEINGIILYQIQALVCFSSVNGGDLGGWVKKESNLSQEGDAWVYGNAQVYGGVWEISPLQISGTLWFFNISSYTTIQIGCKSFTFEELEKSAVQIAKDNNYTDLQIQEYQLYFELAKKWKELYCKGEVCK